jgi:glycosidase
MTSSLRRLSLLLVLLAAACGSGASPAPPPPIPPGVDVTPVVAADPGSPLPATWLQGPFMEIYVRGYADGNGDGTGDLAGLTAKLDYLHDLGVTGLWLMPVNASQDHDHGYAVADYRAIEAGYGTQADLDALVAAAHARGLGVIIDYVMNHSASANALFQASAADAPGGWRDWYVWAAGHPGGWRIYGGDPWRGYGASAYYAPFSGSMPDFNLRNGAVVAYHHDNQRYWLNRGVDGFRFDAVGMLVENGPGAWSDQPENYALMADVRTLLGGYANRFMVCEDPDGTAAFAACGAAFDFGEARRLRAAATGDAASLAALVTTDQGLDPGLARQRATFLANHDAFTGGRVMDQVGGDEARARLAAALLLLRPGTPFLYYGEEIGMSGAAGLSGDWKIRTPMSWTAEPIRAGFTTGTPFRALSANVGSHNVADEVAAPGSLLAWYRALIALRRGEPALATGVMEGGQVHAAGLVSFQRRHGTSHLLVLVNSTSGAAVASVTLAGLPAGAVLTGRFPAGTADLTAAAGGIVSVTVPAVGVAVYAWTP